MHSNPVSSHWPEPRSPGSRAAYWAIPALGLLLAAVVVFDPLATRAFSRHLFGNSFAGLVPMLAAPLLLLLLALLVAGIRNSQRLFARRETLYILLLFVPTQFIGFNVANIEASKIGILIVLMLWSLDLLAERRALRFYPPLLVIWMGMLAFAFASTVNGGVISIVSLYSIFAKLLVFVLTVNVIRSWESLHFAMRLLVALGLFTSLAAFAQEAIFYFYHLPLTLDDNAPKFWFKDTPFGPMLRASAFHPTSENMAHFLLLAVALALFGTFSPRFKFFAALIMGGAIFLTFSGNAMLMLLVLLLLALFMRKPALSLHYLSVIALVGAALYFTGGFTWLNNHFIATIAGKSTQDRLSLLQLGIEMIERHPWVGMGLNNFGRVSPQPVHNAYFQLATETGVGAAVLLMSLLLLIGARLAIAVQQLHNLVHKNAAKGVLLGLIVLAGHFLFEPFFTSPISWSYIGLAEAAAMVLLAARACAPEPTAAAAPAAPSTGVMPTPAHRD